MSLPLNVCFLSESLILQLALVLILVPSSMWPWVLLLPGVDMVQAYAVQVNLFHNTVVKVGTCKQKSSSAIVPKLLWLVVPLIYWGIGCSSPFGLLSYTLYSSVDFPPHKHSKDSRAGFCISLGVTGHRLGSTPHTYSTSETLRLPSSALWSVSKPHWTQSNTP